MYYRSIPVPSHSKSRLPRDRYLGFGLGDLINLQNLCLKGDGLTQVDDVAPNSILLLVVGERSIVRWIL